MSVIVEYLVRDQHILDEVKNRDLIAYRGEQAVSIGREEEVSFAIDRPQEVGELAVSAGVPQASQPAPTLKSVFIVASSAECFKQTISSGYRKMRR
jgi:hypothetical protein